MRVLTAGFGLSRITPPSAVYLAGYAARTNKSESVHDELYARALVLSDGECAIAMVSVDVLALEADFVERARNEISLATALVPQAVMIAATHTHGGPITAAMFSPEGHAPDPKYMEQLLRAIVSAVETAWTNRFPTKIGVGTVRMNGVGGNRHRLDGATDPELGVLKITDSSGQARAVCLNYACHPTVLGPDNLRITADFPGFLVAKVTESLGDGAFAMFLNGAAGNISVGRSPAATALGLASPGRTFERAASIGHALADSALELLPSIETTADCTLDFGARSVQLAFRALPSPEETDAAKHRAQELVEELRRSNAAPAEIQKAQLDSLYAALTHFESSRRGRNVDRASIEIQCLRIGDTTFVGIPMEPFVEIGLELKRAAGTRLFMVELANGYLGYLPASAASEESGYEAVSARFATGSDRILVPQALELERELFERDRGRRTHS